MPIPKEERLGSIMRKALIRTNRTLNHHLAPAGISIREYSVLSACHDEGYKQQALIRRLAVHPNVAVLTLKEMEQRGLISRAPNKRDRRQHVIVLTDQGVEVFRVATPLILAAHDELYSQFSPAERREFLRLINMYVSPIEDTDPGKNELGGILAIAAPVGLAVVDAMMGVALA
jgi:DNA-binding MarR family transcriptional regulator